MTPSLRSRFVPSLCFGLLIGFSLVLLVAGGASRADAFGQVIVRAAAAGVLATAILFGPRPALADARPVSLLLGGCILLGLLQLIPLPPAMWQGLPGRALFVEAAAASGQAQPWRPWSLVPGATINAVASLIVPLTMLVLIGGLTEQEKARLPTLLLALILASTLMALLQFSGGSIDNRLINDTPGVVSGTFANRNHFALFVAMGCVLTPVWAFPEGKAPRWRAGAAIALLLLFALTILATGSRSGIVLGAVAIGAGLFLTSGSIKRELRRFPRWVFPVIIVTFLALIGALVGVSIAADRAVSIERLLEAGADQDLRRQALPTIVGMVQSYFPFGSGLGGFDAIYRIDEPGELLSLSYLNHAHNDYLEIALDAGLPGLGLLAAGLIWWAWASLRVWRDGDKARRSVARLGSALLLIVMLASVTDYPARTPMIMAMMVVAGVWLAGSAEKGRRSALPSRGEPLYAAPAPTS